MAQTDFDELIRQLSDEDAQARRRAAKRLGELKRPEAIPELASVYSRDTDETVRKAAADALRVFRRMEQEFRSDDNEPRGGGLSSTLLRRIRGLLVFTLALSVVGNVALVVSRALPNLFAPGASVQTIPTPREQLTDSFGKRIADAREEALSLRGVYSGLQGLGAQYLKLNQPQCEKLQSSAVNPADLGNLDAITYPDLKTVHEQITQAQIGLVPLRNTAIALCANPTQSEVDKQLAAQGGPAAIITKIDSITNKDLADAQASLKKAIDNPAPTVGPTFTPTPPPTATPAPTATPGPSTATPAVTQASGTQVGGAAAAPTGGATSAPTLASSITFTGLGLETLKTYRYQVNAKAEGTYSNGRAFSGTLKIVATRQVSPLAAEYEVAVSDTNARDFNVGPQSTASLIKRLAGPLYVPGSLTYTILEQVRYQVNNAPPARCQALRATGERANIPDFTFQDLEDVALTLTPPDEKINGVDVKHYHGEKQGGFNNQFTLAFDVYLSADRQLPIRVVEKVTLNKPGPRTPSPTGFATYSLTVTYDLQAQNTEVRVLKPIVCNDVPVR